MAEYTDTVISYRLGEVETAVKKKADQKEVQTIAEEVRRLRATLNGFIVAIAISTCTFAGGVVAVVLQTTH